jgi:hypothetical protein
MQTFTLNGQERIVRKCSRYVHVHASKTKESLYQRIFGVLKHKKLIFTIGIFRRPSVCDTEWCRCKREQTL